MPTGGSEGTANASASERTVARPLLNLGNTCYMNAVLQALAHAPELCLALDCESHHKVCPIALSEQQNRSQPSSSPRNSPESNVSNGSGNGTQSKNEPAVRKGMATRKSRRSGRKSPLIGSSDTSNDGDGVQFCTLCEVEKHLQQMHDSSFHDKPVAPTSFVHGFINHIAPQLKLGVQEDSHEFLRLLIEAMQKSCERARKHKSLIGNDFKKNIPTNSGDPAQKDTPSLKAEDTTDTCHGKDKTDDKQQDTEYPFSLFCGKVESTVTCESCGASSSTLDPVEDLGLDVTADIPAAPSNGTRNGGSAMPLGDIQLAFSRFSRVEALDAGYKCEKCGKIGRATKQSRLASIAPILTLHLKRFRFGDAAAGIGGGTTITSSGRRSGRSTEVQQLLGSSGSSDYYLAGCKSGSSKIEGHIKFDLVFDLKPYLTKKLQEKHKNMFCRLFAVVVHSGANSHSGHYVAYVRNMTKNEWWKMDDCRVSRVTEEQVMQAEAYMLFYRVMQHPITTKLDELNKKRKRDEAALAASEAASVADDTLPATPSKRPRTSDRSSSTSTAATTVSPVTSDAVKTEVTKEKTDSGDSKTSKRPVEVFSNGVEWARAKTMIPSKFLNVIEKLQELVADDILSTHSTKIESLASSNVKENGLLEEYRDRVGEVLKQIIKVVTQNRTKAFWKKSDEGGAISTREQGNASANKSTGTSATSSNPAISVKRGPAGMSSAVPTTAGLKPATEKDQRVAVVEPEDSELLL